MPPIPLHDVLLSLTEARFNQVLDALDLGAWVTERAPPVVRARELYRHGGETPAGEARLRATLAREVHAWSDDVLARWRAWSTRRLGEIPILGFQGTMRAPVDLQQAFVPLALAVRHEVGDHRPDGDMTRWMGWTLKGAVSHAASEGVTSVRGLVLVGLPRSGKTTLLKHAWGVVADRGAGDLGFSTPGLVPVFVRVAWCDPAHAEHEILPAALRRGLQEHGHGSAVDLQLQQPLLWMLDGLDEAGSLDRRKALAERLGQAMDHRPDDRYLLTSRTAGWRDVEGMLRRRERQPDPALRPGDRVGA